MSLDFKIKTLQYIETEILNYQNTLNMYLEDNGLTEEESTGFYELGLDSNGIPNQIGNSNDVYVYDDGFHNGSKDGYLDALLSFKEYVEVL